MISRPVAARWAWIPAVTAPLALVGGWTLAAQRQTRDFSSVRDTISALAGRTADDRWIMTVGLGVLGLAHIGTAASLSGARLPGRLVLAAGGAATVMVAFLPLPASGPSRQHGVAAGVAFVALSLWPALAGSPAAHVRVLRTRPALCASAVLFATLGAFAAELARQGDHIGLTERAAAGAQAVWPLVVVTAALRRASR